MNIKQYLDATYLKTAAQAGVSENENLKIVKNYIQEAIDEEFKLIMIRPEMVTLAKEMIAKAKSKVDIGTVIDFPVGNSHVEKKLKEAKKAIEDGANDLDFVCNYEAFKNFVAMAVATPITTKSTKTATTLCAMSTTNCVKITAFCQI